jgi:hypothetical protein
MVSCGAGSRGVDGPNAPMELGVNTALPVSRATSSTFINVPMFTSYASCGARSADADSRAAR